MTRLLLRVCDRLGIDAVAAPVTLTLVGYLGVVLYVLAAVVDGVRRYLLGH